MSEETKNPLIESFLKLHELVGGTYQDTLPMAQRLKNAELARKNREFQRQRPFDRKDVPSGGAGEGSGGQPSTMRVVPPRPAMDTAPQPQPNMALQRQQSGDVAPKPQPSMSLQRQQSGDVAPKIDNSASMNRAKTDYQTRVGGVERQNPILAPGKLEGGNLQMGSRGDSVKELQRKLGIKDDGIFGPQTAAALKSFQQKNNLKVDAVYGRQSASAMNKQSGMSALKKENPVGAYVSSQTVKPMSPMAGQGSSGADSKTLPVRNNTSAPVTTNSGSLLPKNSSLSQNIISGGQSLGGNLPAGLHGNTTYVGKDGKIYDRVRSLKLNNEEPEMTNKLIEAFMKLQTTNSSNLFNEAKKAKKLDPVGKENEDIDNDGDKDKSDSYLHNRRKKIAAAMKEAKDPHAEGMVKAGTKAPEMTTDPDYAKKKPAVQTPNRAEKGSLPKGVTVKANEEVEQIDESLTAAHKKAVANHLKKMWGKGTVSFDKQDGNHFATHNDGIESQVHSVNKKGGKLHVAHFMTVQEEVEHIDEGVGVRNRVRKAILVGAKSAKNDKEHEINKNIITKLTGKKEAGKTYDAARKMVAKEEIEFSEAELAHIAAILEANPVAPVPDDYSGAANGVSKRDLSDETVAEEEMKRGRGRPKGSKSGSKHGSGGDSAVETKNLAAQIRFSRPSGGNFTLKHPTTGETKSVPAKAATEFYNKYSGAEKPAQKQAHHDEFVAKHFGSKEKTKSSGISLPKMPAPKS